MVVKGITPLHPLDVSIPDLRAGFAYVMATLIAEGKSTIHGISYLERGYEDLTTKLTSLGADLVVVAEKPPKGLLEKLAKPSGIKK